MKDLRLFFTQRFKVIDILGQVSGTLDKMATLSPVFTQLQFSEDEVAAMRIEDIGGGRKSYTPPYPAFGEISIQIEDSQATALLEEVSNFPRLTIMDVSWVEDLKSQLTAASVKPRATTQVTAIA